MSNTDSQQNSFCQLFEAKERTEKEEEGIAHTQLIYILIAAIELAMLRCRFEHSNLCSHHFKVASTQLNKW